MRTQLPLWIGRARNERDRAWSPRAGGVLTQVEQRIAELVAAGRTNPEIAAALFVSRRTVEAALTRCYRKLGVRNRAELVSAINATPDAAAPDDAARVG